MAKKFSEDKKFQILANELPNPNEVPEDIVLKIASEGDFKKLAVVLYGDEAYYGDICAIYNYICILIRETNLAIPSSASIAIEKIKNVDNLHSYRNTVAYPHISDESYNGPDSAEEEDAKTAYISAERILNRAK